MRTLVRIMRTEVRTTNPFYCGQSAGHNIIGYLRSISFEVLIPMPDARCPMPDARCPMPDAQFPIPHNT
ncbi:MULTISPECIES: hypothetical protein [unclassified Microcoleus]|uniref:hypothetical protein n=1 Tax=unclassified Microcoleus TaxID=2642155 RepID=UPI0025D97399|nr:MULTISPECIES: hypothetical protein [unclassified Microcoleus]